jgi:hypothetical protein
MDWVKYLCAYVYVCVCVCIHKTLENTGNPRYTWSHFTRFRYNVIYGEKSREKIVQ